MDTGSMNLTLIEIVGAAALLLVMLIVVMKTRSRGKQDSNARTEAGTREVYREEEATRRREES